MPNGPISQVILQFRTASMLHNKDGSTDGELLGALIDHQDEAAFAALVRLHGPMVWGVCRRLLNHHDAEEAFQATFLVLFRKAASVQPRQMVANWLYGVAHQTALFARRTIARRRARERQVVQMPEVEVVERDLWTDLQPLIDQELSRLPNRYRSVLVLCDLEGKTRSQAAHQLGLPEGTIGSRLARGRSMLAKRLARHGFAMSGAALATMLSQNLVSAYTPLSVISSIIRAANLYAAEQTVGVTLAKVAILTEGVMNSMFLTKLKTLIVILSIVVFGGVLFTTTIASGQSKQPKTKRIPIVEKSDQLISNEQPIPDVSGTWYGDGTIGVPLSYDQRKKENSRVPTPIHLARMLVELQSAGR
jgi:RNA polymerase sigma factor (sigma-70 family)